MDRDYLIEKWLKNELTDAEKEAFSQWDDYDLNLKIIEQANSFKAAHFSEVDDFSTFKKHHRANRATKKSKWFNSPLLRIASILVVALGFYFSFFFNNATQIETLASEKTTLELPDHSQVTLNALSEIVYNEKDWKNHRTLTLKGEAYFKVSKGKTFDVKTKEGLVTVVGTQFNVKQREAYFEVQCFEGIVKVTSDTITKALLAGDTFRLLNGVFTQGKTTATKSEWTEDVSTFDAIPFKEVLAELERQYHIEIVMKDILPNRLFTGGFTHNNLKDALISITQPMNLNYELSSSNLVVIYGESH